MTEYCSRLSGLRDLSPVERFEVVCGAAGKSVEALACLGEGEALPLALADGMIENVIGRFEMPLGVAANFCCQWQGLSCADGCRGAVRHCCGVVHGEDRAGQWRV